MGFAACKGGFATGSEAERTDESLESLLLSCIGDDRVHIEKMFGYLLAFKQKGGSENFLFSSPYAFKQYVDSLCRELPTLIEVDGISNPRPLSEEQMEQTASLEDNFGVLRSQIANIDLRDRDFGYVLIL